MNHTVQYNGEEWRVLGVGRQREDGKVYAHLASVTRGRQRSLCPLPSLFLNTPGLANPAPRRAALRQTRCRLRRHVNKLLATPCTALGVLLRLQH